jgi:hypothetical protein
MGGARFRLAEVATLTRLSPMQVAALTSARSASSTATPRSLVPVSAATPTETASTSSLLRLWPVDSILTRAATSAGTSIAAMPSLDSRRATCSQS